MPREIIDSDFYIALLSDGSAAIHPNNTLSQFTNTLSRPCRLDDGIWTVGLTEIGLNNVIENVGALSSKYIDRSRDRELVNVSHSEPSDDEESVSENNSLECLESMANSPTSDDVEIISPIPSPPPAKKRKKSVKPKVKRMSTKRSNVVAPKAISITVDENTSIDFTSADLDEIMYSNYRKDINFGKFLEFISRKINPMPEKRTQVDVVKSRILDRVMDVIDSKEWDKIDKEYNLIRNPDTDYLLHVYMGSTVSSNVVFKATTASQTLEEFVTSVITQIPKKRRNKDKMKELFRIFYPNYLNDDYGDGNVLQVLFGEYGVTFTSNVDELRQKKGNKEWVWLHDLMEDLGQNAFSMDGTQQHLMENNPQLLSKIKSSVLDIFKGGLDETDVIMKLDNTITVLIDVDENRQIRLILPIAKYKRASTLVNQINAQLPDDLRTPEFITNTINKLFQQSDDMLAKQLGTKASSSGSSSNNNNITNTTNTIATNTNSTTNGGTDNVGTIHISEPSLLRKHTHGHGLRKMMFVYLDIIRPRRIASESVRALKLIPYDGSTNYYIFNNVEYIPLEKTLFDSISVRIADGHGVNINFVDSYKPTYLMLHFKKMT